MLGKFSFSSVGSVAAMTAAVGAMVVVGACSASTDSISGAGAGKSSGNGGDGGGFLGMGGSNTSPVGGSCAATVNKAEKVPLGMSLMVDKSSSMTETAGGGGTKWAAVTSALKAFVDQPSAAGIGIGLQYFPLETGVSCSVIYCAKDTDCGPTACGPCQLSPPPLPGVCSGFGGGGSCEVVDYAMPAVVITNLPGIAPIIKSSLDNTQPSGGTPTTPALDGAITYTKQWMTMNPSAVGVVILATDGVPSGCNSDLNGVAAIAAAGLSGTPSVKTFVIGVGSELTALNGIAAAGGTGQAFLVDTNAGAQDQFLKAMNEIRGAALSCAYLIPPPPANEMIDYGAINVQYTADGAMPVLMPQVSSPAGCPADGLAWYYDNKMPPQQILLCPSTCNTVSADKKGQIDVLVGCATVIK